jgi:hypothetical protein
MNWVRSNIKHGSRLALLALALQFGLSFGHYHTGATQAATLAIQSVAASDVPAAAADAVEPSAQLSTPQDDSDQHAGEACAICAVIALARSVLLTPQLSLLLPQAVDLSYLTADAGFVHSTSPRLAFQPRAPPAS